MCRYHLCGIHFSGCGSAGVFGPGGGLVKPE